MKKLFLLLIFCLCAPSLYAQDTFHVFPQIVDGTFADGSFYKSTFMILPWFDTDAPTCSLRFYGLSLTLDSTHSNTYTITFPAGSYYAVASAADQGFDSGYATLTCSDYVFAQVLYSFYAPGGFKLSEATVFGSDGNYSAKMILDQRGGAGLGVAIANNTDIAHTYRLTIGARTATVQIPARTALARFVNEIMPAGSVPAVGILQIESTDFSQFDAIGLRVTGSAFTTIPAN